MSSVLPERRVLVDKAAAKWADQLIDLGAHNTLLRFRDTKTRTVNLTDAEPEALGQLLGGKQVRLRRLYPDPLERDDPLKRFRNLRRTALMIEEEQGVAAARIGVGLLNGPAPRGREFGTAALRAPLILRGLVLQGKGQSVDDLELQVEGDPEVNPVLLYALAQQYGLDSLTPIGEKIENLLQEISDPREQARRAFAELAAAGERNGIEFTSEDRVVAGVYSYEKLPMVQDLRGAGALLADHDLVSAIAGDASAVETLSGRAPYDPQIDHDARNPRDDYLVLDADSSQQRAIDIALSGRHLVIDGPPGTGKSQTIANLIAALAARGQRVLFVAEKRAAIEAVTERLDGAGLDRLVFDLHHDGLKRKDVAKQMADAFERAQSVLRPDTERTDRLLARSRGRLVDHVFALRKLHEPWQATVLDLLDMLAGVPAEAASEVRFRGAELAGLDAAVSREVIDLLAGFVAGDGLRFWRGDSPWSRSPVTKSQEVADTLATLDTLTTNTLRSARMDLFTLVQRLGLRAPDNLAAWQHTLRLLNDVTDTLGRYPADVFDDGLDDLWFATGPRAWRKGQNRQVGYWRRRALVKRARRLRRGGVRDRNVLHAELGAALQQRDAWRQRATVRPTPCAVPDIDVHLRLLRQAQSDLTAVVACARIPDLSTMPDAEVDERLRVLDEARDDLMRMPAINQTRARLAQLGLGPLLDDLARRSADADQAVAAFRYAWATSVLEHVKIHTPGLAGFTGTEHDRAVLAFQDAERRHAEQNVERVRRAIAERLRGVMNDHPKQAGLVRHEAGKKSRHKSLRELVEQAPDVLLGTFPCWAMSPLSVSRTLPPERLFDVVIFDEASQVEPQDAITSIVRGERLIVAGDDRQLPPSDFFRRHLAGAAEWDGDEDADEPADDLGDFESILDRMKALIPDRTRLRWHYRSRDERLIAFSNEEIYDRDLVTFPGVTDASPLSFVPVEGTAHPGQGSPEQEVRRVVELVTEHAHTRPKETLGVITFGDRHRDRVQMALNDKIRTDDELAAFCAEDKGPARRFFVKNLERVQGDERDAIILSVGYAKRPSGAQPPLGPLAKRGGERRLNVAVTRARTRMTVVASFTHHDLHPERATNAGPELLRNFLGYAARTGVELSSGRLTGAEMNDFERQVAHAMRDAGLPVFPQWGASGYRIDFALAHPGQPGRMVLAVETDGARYHSSPSARDRDRLRQEHLRRLGWRFHRVWSLDWARDPDGELARIRTAWDRAIDAADRDDEAAPQPVEPGPRGPADQDDQSAFPASASTAARPEGRDRGPRPPISRLPNIRDYTPGQLTELCTWLLRDGLALDRETRMRQAMDELGFHRLASEIRKRLGAAVDGAERKAARQGDE